MPASMSRSILPAYLTTAGEGRTASRRRGKETTDSWQSAKVPMVLAGAADYPPGWNAAPPRF